MAIKGYGVTKGNKSISWHTIRVSINCLEKIDKWGMESGFSSRSEATRKLIEIGLNVIENKKAADQSPNMISAASK